jgi:formylglycine-generating enzyme required for sulfatase activity
MRFPTTPDADSRVVQKPPPEPDVGASAVPHVFISFASADADLAHRAVESLERSGLRCWIADRDIEPATSYPGAITDAVKASGVVLLLLTESSSASPHVIREIELAFNARRPILPVRVGGVTPSADLHYFLSRAQWLDAGSAFDATDLARVEPRLKELLATGGHRRGPVVPRWWRRMVAMAAIVAVVAVAGFVVWTGRRDRDQPSTGPAVDGGATTATPTGSMTPTGSATPTVPTPKVNPHDGQAYVWIPPGRFTMGCSSGDPDCADDEKPAHVVEITGGFWLARTEVTDAQHRKAVAAARVARGGALDRLPAIEVSWAAATRYCAGVGGRLPTEAEWEYAARAGTSTRYYDSLPGIAWFADNSDGRVRPVGEKTPNAFGLHDMLGNVSEWVRDRYYNAYDDSSHPSVVEEPLAGNASGVARGGSWVSEAPGVRVSRRLEMPPDAEEPHIGFRCALDRL